MRLGFGLLQTGKNTGPDNVSRVARRAEELGYDSLWVFDRLLYPVKPQTPYPGGGTARFRTCTEECWTQSKRSRSWPGKPIALHWGRAY